MKTYIITMVSGKEHSITLSPGRFKAILSAVGTGTPSLSLGYTSDQGFLVTANIESIVLVKDEK